MRSDIKEKLDGILMQYQKERSDLIPILQEAQEKFGYLPEEVIAEIATAEDQGGSQDQTWENQFSACFHALKIPQQRRSEPYLKRGFLCLGFPCPCPIIPASIQAE